jgi:iron complex outermembrane receptor protein
MKHSRTIDHSTGAAKSVAPLFPLLIAAMVTCLALPAWSQDTDDNPANEQQTQATGKKQVKTLDQIVVVGSRRPESISEIPASVIVVTADDIQQRVRGGVTLKELLGQLVPALDVGSQTRTNASQNLQGRDAQVMIDGVSLNSTRGIHRQFDSIDPFNIDYIVVLSGASSIYGAGATGGIIDIVTKKGSSGPLGVTLQAGLGTKGASSIDDRQAAASLQGGSDRVTGRIAFAWHEYGQFYGADGEKIFPDISQTALEHNLSKDLMGSLGFDFGEAGTVHFLAQHYDSQMIDDKTLYLGPNLAGLFGYPQLLEVRDGYQSDFTPGTRRNLFTADWSAPGLVFGQDLLLQAFARSEDLNFYPFPGFAPVTVGGQSLSVPYYSASSQNTRLKGLKSALITHFGRSATLTYGVDYTHDQFESAATLFDTATAFGSGGLDFITTDQIGRYPGFTSKQLAAYAQMSWKVTPDVNLTAGVRQQRIDISVEDFVAVYEQIAIANGVASAADSIPGGSNHYNATLPNLGVVWSFVPGQQLYANYSVGFTVPDPAKYYGTGDYTLAALGGRFVLGDSTNINTSPLGAIKTGQVEGGFRGSANGFQYNLAAFYAKSDKAVQTIPVTLNVVEFDQPLRTYGIQGKVSYDVTPNWRIGASGIWVRTELKENGAWQKATVTSSSPPKLVTSVGYSPNEAFSATLQATTIGNLSDADGNNLQGYTTVDLLAAQRFGKWWINAGIQNLFDKRYQTIWSQRQQILAGPVLAPAVYFQGIGRSYTITATVDF